MPLLCLWTPEIVYIYCLALVVRLHYIAKHIRSLSFADQSLEP